MQKIKRTDVRKRSARKSLFKTIVIVFILAILFLIGFFTASFLTKIF